MSPETRSSSLSSPCLVRVRVEPDGLFTACLVGQSELAATAPSREEAVEQLRAKLRQQFDEGSLLWVELLQENPLMRWFGHAKDDPDFEGYLAEIRRFREEMDLREKQDSDPAECPDASLTATT